MLLAVLFILLTPALLIVGLLLLTEKRARQRFHTKDGKLMPGPSIFEALARIIKTPNFIQLQVDRKQKYGNIYCGFLATLPVIFINDAETVKKVMLETKQFGKAAFSTDFGNRFTGKNVLTLNGDEWKKIRVMMNPAFAKLDDVLLDKFVLKTRETLNVIDAQQLERPNAGIDVVTVLQEMTLDIIGLTAFNYDFRSLSKGGVTKEVESYHFLFKEMFNIFHLLIPHYLSLPIGKNVASKKHLDIFNGLIKDMVVKSKERVAREHNPTCLLDMMTAYTDEETGQKLSDEELRANTVILFIAGHETTANALSFAFYILAKHPEIQQKLYEEIANNTKHITSDSQIDCDTVNNIEYLNYFIKETMRVHPPVTQLPLRKTTAKDEIIEGFTVPKGSNVAVNIYNLHHDERYWKDPHTFDPYRWTPENSQGRPFYAYIPFGGGSRVCIGNNFSLLEQRVFLTMLLREYKVEFADPDYQLSVSATAIISTPLNLKIKLTKRF